MKFRHCLFKILKNQNVADSGMDGRADEQRENSISPHKHSLQGYNKDTVLISVQRFFFKLQTNKN